MIKYPILIDEENFPESLLSIDLSKDVVFCTPESQKILKFNEDGRISLISSDNLNISMLPHTNYADSREIKRRINMKFSVPTGITPLFKAPEQTSYISVYPKFKSYEGYKFSELENSYLSVKEKNFSILSSLSDYHIYDDVYLKSVFNLVSIREENPLSVMNFDNPLCDILLLVNGYHNSINKPFRNLVFIHNDYIYENFKNQLS